MSGNRKSGRIQFWLGMVSIFVLVWVSIPKKREIRQPMVDQRLKPQNELVEKQREIVRGSTVCLAVIKTRLPDTKELSSPHFLLKFTPPKGKSIQSIRTQRTRMFPFSKPLDNVCFPFRLDRFNPFAFHTLKSPPHEKAQQLKTVWAFPPKHIMMHENHSSRKATSLRRANKSWKLAIGWL